MSKEIYDRYISYLINQQKAQQQILIETQLHELLGINAFENVFQVIFFFSIFSYDSEVIKMYEEKYKTKLDQSTLEKIKNYYLNCKVEDLKMFESEGQMELFLLYQRESGNDKLIQEVVDEYYQEDYSFKEIMDRRCKNEIKTLEFVDRIVSVERRLASLENEILTDKQLTPEMTEEIIQIVKDELDELKTTFDVENDQKIVQKVKEETDELFAKITYINEEIELLKEGNEEKERIQSTQSSYTSDFIPSLSSLNRSKCTSGLITASFSEENEIENDYSQINERYINDEQCPRYPSKSPEQSNESFTEHYSFIPSRTKETIPSKQSTGYGYQIYPPIQQDRERERERQASKQFTTPIPNTLKFNYATSQIPIYQKKDQNVLKFSSLTTQEAKPMKYSIVIERYLDSMVKLTGQNQGAMMIDMKKNKTFLEIFKAMQGCKNFILLIYLNTGEIFGSFHSVHPVTQGQEVKDEKHFIFTLANSYNEPMRRYDWLKKEENVLKITEEEIVINGLGVFGCKRSGYVFSEKNPMNLQYDNTPVLGRRVFTDQIYPKKFTWKDIQLIKIV